MNFATFTEESITFVAEDIVSTSDNFPAEYYPEKRDKSFALVKYYSFSDIVSTMPFIHYMIFFAFIVFLSFFLNFLVLLYYRKSNDMRRLYILALVAIDWVNVSCLIPVAFLAYADLNATVKQSLFVICLILLNSGFGLYLYPSLFLALDRMLIVMFPFTHRDYLRKLRCVKVACVSIHLTLCVIDSIMEFVYGVDSLSYTILKTISTCLILFALLIISILYVSMAVEIVRSNRKLTNLRKRGAKAR